MLFAFRYRCNEAGTDGVMKNNAMHVFFNNKEFHKMATPMKIKIAIFQPSVLIKNSKNL